MKYRLQKLIAQAGICSRRKAEQLIKEGRISVNGTIVTEMGLLIDPFTNFIELDGKEVPPPPKNIYILLNKPKGFVTTLNDPQGRPTVLSLLKEINTRVFPVGRLDQDTEGALILTNDGPFAHRILHPKFEIKRTYHALVAGIPSRSKLRLLASGIEIEGHRTWPAKVRLLSTKKKKALLELIIHEGKKRQVRKMCAAIGYPVVSLKRVAYGNLKIHDLAPGEYKLLEERELRELF